MTRYKIQQKRTRKMQQRGGLYGLLYGATYEPVGGKDGNLDKAVQKFRTIISLKNLAARVVSGTVLTRYTPLPMIGSIANALFNSMNFYAREKLLLKLNESAGRVNKIMAPHIWSDVDEGNLITDLNNPLWVADLEGIHFRQKEYRTSTGIILDNEFYREKWLAEKENKIDNIKFNLLVVSSSSTNKNAAETSIVKSTILNAAGKTSIVNSNAAETDDHKEANKANVVLENILNDKISSETGPPEKIGGKRHKTKKSQRKSRHLRRR